MLRETVQTESEHALHPRHLLLSTAHIQRSNYPSLLTSSVPEMSASRSPRGLLLLPSLATQDATSAFTGPLRKHGREASCIMGLKREY